MQRWEYVLLEPEVVRYSDRERSPRPYARGELESIIRELGMEGFELVSAVSVPTTSSIKQGFFKRTKLTTEPRVVMYFKRPIEHHR
jgi:hypothetical protein